MHTRSFSICYRLV